MNCDPALDWAKNFSLAHLRQKVREYLHQAAEAYRSGHLVEFDQNFRMFYLAASALHLKCQGPDTGRVHHEIWNFLNKWESSFRIKFFTHDFFEEFIHLCENSSRLIYG
jgi:hypothetical protein